MTKNARAIRIEGNLAYVPLTQGYEAIIDVEDVPLVERQIWMAKLSRNTVYAVRTGSRPARRPIYLHRVLMGEPDGLEVDHKDGNGLNNRRHGEASNLRTATSSQNRQNAHLRRDNTSGFRGVWRDKARNKWQAEIAVNGKRVWRNRFDTKEAAAIAYAEANARFHGEFGRTA